ncbi:DUF6927 domain-containing protein [Pseudoclavibacter soli]|uniref:DUF6927 domain-containing protein n=1 Tax=Pseudoclavibacter soli TaxID=452623 RepID=UPI00040E0EDD|nr:hypothetical protein [Pseudoclavibacter soli]
MDETSGPYQSECPTRILDLLTDTDDEQARQWRARCRQYAQLKTVAHTAHRITVAEPLRFQRIGLVAHFRHVGRRWYDATTGIRLSVSDQVVLSRKVIAAVDSSGADLPVPALS